MNIIKSLAWFAAGWAGVWAGAVVFALGVEAAQIHSGPMHTANTFMMIMSGMVLAVLSAGIGIAKAVLSVDE